MSQLYFAKPSHWRILWSVVAVAVLASALLGCALFIGAIATHHDTGPTPGGDYLLLFILDLTFWGPTLLLTIWQVSVPVVIVLGVLLASLRKTHTSGTTTRNRSSAE